MIEFITLTSLAGASEPEGSIADYNPDIAKTLIKSGEARLSTDEEKTVYRNWLNDCDNIQNPAGRE